MNHNNGLWLEVICPESLATEMGGKFHLHLASKLADGRADSKPSWSEEEPGLSPGIKMHSDYYFYKRRGKADEAFQYACTELSAPQHSHRGSEYLVKLVMADEKGELDLHPANVRRPHKGRIGIY